MDARVHGSTLKEQKPEPEDYDQTTESRVRAHVNLPFLLI
jgi:hypothetical protein